MAPPLAPLGGTQRQFRGLIGVADSSTQAAFSDAPPFGGLDGGDLSLESIGGRLVRAFVQVAVDIENGPYRCVSEAVGDQFRVLTLGDQQCDLRASERVGSETMVEVGCGERRLPGAACPGGSANWSAFRG